MSNDRLLITPSGFSKGDIQDRWLLVVDMNGKPIRGARGPKGEELRLTSEIRMHTEVYRQRPDVNAVVHAHPPVATGFSLAGVPLAGCLLPEVVFTLGAIPTTKFAAPTTEDVPESVKELIQTFDALVLDRHGALTVGKDIWDAYFKLEKIEHTAVVMLTAHQLGGVRELSQEERQKVVEVGKSLGIRSEAMAVCKVDESGNSSCTCSDTNTCTPSPNSSEEKPETTLDRSDFNSRTFIRQVIMEELKNKS
jgi:L-fuculose-phosphate aldolase